MTRTLDDYLEHYLYELFSDDDDVYIPDMVNEYKSYMGRNISSQFCSFMSDDEEIVCFLRCPFFVWSNMDFLHLGALSNYNWLLCITTKKVIAFSNGFFGLGLANKAVKVFPLKNINSIELCGKKRFKLICGQSTYYFELFDQGIGYADPCMVEAYIISLNELLDSQSDTASNIPPSLEQPSDTECALAQLERLSQLYQQGLLTEQEFQFQKQKILGNQ